MRVLVVEDERRLASIIKRGLIEEGYAVDTVYDGEEAQYMGETTSYDIIILDIMLPKKDGIAVCKELRAGKINTPILMLTARDSVEDRVKGLDSGADDYLVKPFFLAELLARMRALLRREHRTTSPVLRIADLVLDTVGHGVRRGKGPIRLNRKEFSLLEYLMRHPGVTLTRGMILEHVWDYSFDPQTNVVDVVVSRLRAKIDPDHQRLETVRGVGYIFRPHA